MQYIERQAAEERPQGRRGSRKSDPRVPRLGAIMHVRKLQAQRRLQTQGGQEGRWLPQHLEMGCRAQLGARLRQWCATFGHCDIKLSPTIVSCFAHGTQYPGNYKLDMSAQSLLCLPVSTQPCTLVVTYVVSQCLAWAPSAPQPQILLSLAISCPQRVAYSL